VTWVWLYGLLDMFAGRLIQALISLMLIFEAPISR
jgi:hypothetical protein